MALTINPSAAAQLSAPSIPPDALVCFSHLRWDFVFQRPQHLMSRFAKTMRVFYVEEPVWADSGPTLDVRLTPDGVSVVVPSLPRHLGSTTIESVQAELLERMWAEYDLGEPVIWYCTPFRNICSAHLPARKVVYDCMDELSAFRNAPPDLIACESELLRRADVVFTGGHSLYEAKRHRHGNIHAFPSSVDVAHFNQARRALPEPSDQSAIPHPRIGHYAVLDERLDTNLVEAIARARPDWQFILIGPVVKISPADLPLLPNLHYLGPKSYRDLPAYLGG